MQDKTTPAPSVAPTPEDFEVLEATAREWDMSVDQVVDGLEAAMLPVMALFLGPQQIPQEVVCLVGMLTARMTELNPGPVQNEKTALLRAVADRIARRGLAAMAETNAPGGTA